MTLVSNPSAAVVVHVDVFPTAVLPKANLPLTGAELLAMVQSGSNVYVNVSDFGFGVLSAGVSNLGNTAGQTGLVPGSLVLVGDNNVTLAQATSPVGATVSISGANTVAQSVQTQNVHNVTLSGNTAGALQEVSSGTLTLAGGPNVTLSQVGNAVTISAAAGGGAAFSAGASNLGNTAGSTGVTGTRLVLVGTNAVSLSQSTDAGGGTLSVNVTIPAQTAESNTLGMSNLGNTSGTSGVVSGAQLRYLFAGGANVTLSQSINGASATLTFSAASQTVQTQNVVDVTLSGNTAGALALISSGTMTLAGGNNVTLSQAGNAVTISAANQTVESNTLGMSNLGNTSGTSGVVSGAQLRYLFAGGNNVTLSQSINGASATLTISAFNQTVQTQNLFALTISSNTAGAGALVSSGTLTLAAGANITLSQNAGNAITIIGPSPSGGGFSAGASNLGNTAGSTGVTGTRLVFVGTNAVSLSQSTDANGGTLSVNVTIPAQTVESNTFGMSNLGNTSGTSGVISGGQLRYLFAGGNNITLSQSINGASATLTISAFNQTQESNTAGISNLGNTSGTSGVISGPQIQLLLAGGNNVTLSQSINGSTATVTISAFNQTQESNTLGMSNLGNTSGTSGVISGNQLRLLLAGGNNITLSQSINGSSATITISAPNLGAGAMSAGVSTVGNTAGSTGVTGTRLVFVGTGDITLSQSTDANGGTITFDRGAETLSNWAPYPYCGFDTSAVSNATMFMYPFVAPHHWVASQINSYFSISVATNSAVSITLSLSAAIFSRTGSTFSRASSSSITYTTSVNSGSAITSVWTGLKQAGIPLNMTGTPGEWFLALWQQSSVTRASISQVFGQTQSFPYRGPLNSASNVTYQMVLGNGIYSVSFTTGMPGSINITDIQGANPMLRYPFIEFANFTA